MASQKLTLAVRPRGNSSMVSTVVTWTLTNEPGKPMKKLPEEVVITAGGSASELYQSLATQAGTTVHSLRVTKGSDGTLVPNSRDLQLEMTGLREQSTIYVKDLGMCFDSLVCLLPASFSPP